MKPAEKRFRQQLSQKLTERFREREERENILSWMSARKLKNEVGDPIEFDNHAFLLDIYTDTHPYQVWEKGSQIGLTTTQVFKTIHLSETQGYRIIYTMPTVEDIQIFVKSKVNKILGLNPQLRATMGEGRQRVDTTEEKHFGRGIVHYRGTFKEQHAISITSDLNLHDELDRSDLSVVETYESRLQHSRYKGQWFFSNPKVPDIGVDFYFQMSDQKYWFISCPHCGCRQYIDWFGKDFDNVDKEQSLYVCHKCREEITDETRRDGYWVPYISQKRMPYSGYWIPQTIAPWMSCSDVMKLEREKTTDYFYNFCLGLPYRGTDRVVSEDMIWGALIDADTYAHDNIAMGVDQGGTDENPVLHAAIGNEYAIWELRTFHSWQELEDYIEGVGVGLTVIDGNPKREPVQALRDKYHHKVWAAFYRNDPKGLEVVRWKDREGHVLIGRDARIDQLIDEFVGGQIKLAIPRNHPILRDYIKQWGTLGLFEKIDQQGNIRKVWESSTGIDHFVHSTLYQRTAASRQRLYRRRKGKKKEESQLRRQLRKKGINSLEDL